MKEGKYMSTNNSKSLEYKNQKNLSKRALESKNNENKKVYIINTPYETMTILDDFPKKKIKRR